MDDMKSTCQHMDDLHRRWLLPQLATLESGDESIRGPTEAHTRESRNNLEFCVGKMNCKLEMLSSVLSLFFS